MGLTKRRTQCACDRSCNNCEGWNQPAAVRAISDRQPHRRRPGNDCVEIEFDATTGRADPDLIDQVFGALCD